MDTLNNWQPIELPLELSPDLVHVVRVPLNRSPERISLLNELLSLEERARANRFRFDEPRIKFVACRATLRMLLASCCETPPGEIQIQYGDHGKPQLSANCNPHAETIEFSVSHSGQMGLIALTQESKVGVDIEEINPAVKHLRLAERFFALQESMELKNLPSEQQLAGFYRGWTCKEAYIKATGQGFSFPLNQFVVAFDPEKPAELREISGRREEASHWMTKAIDVGIHYAAAVIVARPQCQIRLWDWPID